MTLTTALNDFLRRICSMPYCAKPAPYGCMSCDRLLCAQHTPGFRCPVCKKVVRSLGSLNLERTPHE